MRTLTRYAAAAAALAALTAVSGCAGDGPGNSPGDAATTPAGSPAGSATQETATTPPPAPSATACYDLAFSAVLEPTSDTAPVPCTGPHTTRTVHVGRLDLVVDGHLLAVDSARVQEQVATTCRARVADHLGGSEATRRLSRFEALWFSPTLAESDAGATWFRCDLGLVTRPDTLGTLPARTRGVLDDPKSLDRYGTCGTRSPAATGFRRVTCGQPHTWRARAALDLPAGAKYLGKAATADADSRCRDIDAKIAADNLRLKWSFEWPTKAQWDAGQRYGLCWTPDPA
ncbi:septum formation family protein [Marmoricola sp. RAF53]|uniref:septum formation family protein n=1 Tax=Marmoricola sp. RAF53 TaxID=3233059 RepID=UPI003F99CB38